MDTRVFFYLADSITAAASLAELDAIRELVARSTLDRLERLILERALRSRVDAIVLANPAALDRALRPGG